MSPLIDATCTRIVQQLACDVVYRMSYAEMDAWRLNKQLDKNYLRRHLVGADGTPLLRKP